jgi:hemerythrin superfamily protein
MREMVNDSFGADIIELLKADHRAIEDLLGQISQPGVDQGVVFDLLADVLAVHESAEERVLYPAVEARVSQGNGRESASSGRAA